MTEDEEERSDRPITLPEWVIRYLTENAFGQYTIAEAILAGRHDAQEIEAAQLILKALKAQI